MTIDMTQVYGCQGDHWTAPDPTCPPSDACSCGCGSTGGCTCGGGADPAELCGLSCLKQPRFFSGQVLADGDFNLLVEWTRRRLALQRYTLGWGVVCGLHVTLKPRPEKDSADCLIISAGYAIDACGNDIIVPCEAEYCPPCKKSKPSCDKESDEDTRIVVFDLCLCYAQHPMQPQPKLRSKSCDDRATCDYARIKETYRFSTCEVEEEVDRDETTRKRICEKYNCFVKEIQRLLDAAPNEKWEQVQERLRELLKRCPAETYGFIYKCVEDKDVCKDPNKVAELCHWLLVDLRRSIKHCDCPDPPECTCVPLARVWYDRANCCVHRIECRPPYRRCLRREDPHSCCEKPCVSDCLGLPSEEARKILRECGYSVVIEENRTLKNRVAKYNCATVSIEDSTCFDPIADDLDPGCKVIMVMISKDEDHEMCGCVCAVIKAPKSRRGG